MRKPLLISFVLFAVLASSETAEAKKMSKTFVKGMDEIAADMKFSEAQKACVSTPIYEELGKKDAKEFVKTIGVLKESGMYKPAALPDGIQSADQIQLFDKLTSAYVGFIMVTKGFSMENLKYTRQMSAAKARVADECADVFPGADMNILRPSTDGEE